MNNAGQRCSPWVLFFSEVGLDDVGVVGGKNASLGELYTALAPHGIRTPNGFATTADAYRETLAASGLTQQLRELLDPIDPDDVEDLQKRAKAARALMRSATIPAEITEEIIRAYHQLQEEYGPELTLAVRSSATAEDLPEASFAGAHETYLNISGEVELIEAVRNCYASMFTDRGVHYRMQHGFGHLDVAQSVTVMKMVRSDLASSGVAFTLDTESGFRDVVFITGAWGLGENVVSGAVDPDEFYVFKPTLRTGYDEVLRRKLGSKEKRMVYGTTPSGADGSSQTTVNEPVESSDQQRFCLIDREVVELARMAVTVEDHYTSEAGTSRPMDIEWAKDGVDGQIYLVQARPETVASRKDLATLETYRVESDAPALVTGRAVGSGVASGTVRVITSSAELGEVQPSDVLVASTTNPDWEPVLKTAAAVVTDHGGRTCHAAIVARELGIPAVVGTGDCTELLATGQRVTVSCADGDIGRVLEGDVPFAVDRIEVGNIERPRTHIQMNLGNPDLAFKLAAIPNDGVGLARLEFIISESIGAHPMAFVEPNRLSAPDRKALKALTAGWQHPGEYFIQKLSEGIATIAAAFYPKPVVVRFSDFKTNEYASLLGGSEFEPEEANPMLGFRGAARYTHPAYRAAFALECKAMLRVRNEMGLNNVIPMIPFCRRVAEAKAVMAEMATHGLVRGEKGLEVFVMCEIPNNVISLDEFAEHFDGFSIGSNDLTQLALGVDRDSELVAFDYDETDPGVMKLFGMAIEGCVRNARHSGFCGQAPSDNPDVARFLVEHGIDSISLTPDAIIPTTLAVLGLEARLAQR